MHSVELSSARPAAGAAVRSKPLYRELYVHVLIAIALGVVVGHLWPHTAAAMKPLGDGFIKLIRMLITLIIFCTVVSGIAGVNDMKKVGRIGAKALLYFEVVSTLALGIGLAVAHWVRPGVGFNANPATLDAGSVTSYATQAHGQSVTEFLLNIIPNTVTSAFAGGDILQVLLVSILFGFGIVALGERGRMLNDIIGSLMSVVFHVIGVVLLLAPIGAFGAIAFTVGKYGFASLLPLLKLVLTFYATSIAFILIILGCIARVAGFSVIRFLLYIKEEILIVLGTSSSDSALPSLMSKLEKIGCSRSVVGLVMPTGYTFNTDGTAIYMSLAALFVAQATNTHLTITQELALLAVAMVTSKGASGVSGASFVALVGTLAVVPAVPVAGMALLLGVERFMSIGRALTNMVGNGVAAVVISKWERELDREALAQAMQHRPATTVE